MARFAFYAGLLAALLAPVAASAARPAPITQPILQPVGRWINPHGTVKVETGHCNDKLCGWVVWASPQAVADARDAGIDTLLGTELLRDYHVMANGQWQGQVYVPDMGRTFYSTITPVGNDRLKISGCLLGGWICKTQIWQRG